MRLTAFTDDCLRALIFVALKGGELATIDEIAERYKPSRSLARLLSLPAR